MKKDKVFARLPWDPVLRDSVRLPRREERNTAAAAAVINAAEDDLQTNDVIRVDVDAVSTTAPKGLIITMTARLP